MSNDFDVVIAGGGMAGLSAAITSARLGRRTMVVTGDVPGGQLMSIEKVEGLPGYPDGVPGYDLCPMMQDQASAAGVEFMMTSVAGLALDKSRWRVTTGEGDVDAAAVVLATGSSLKKLGVPGEERLTGSGVSHCATCDAPLMRGRIVAVIGGGDSAMQEALTLAEFAAKVIMVERGSALTGQSWYQTRVSEHPKIEIRLNSAPTEILGDATVAAIRVQDSANGASAEVETAAVFAYVGLDANTGFLSDAVTLDAMKRIPTDAWTRTQLIGLCATGNIRAQSSCRAAGAAGDGASAAVALDRYLSEGSWPARDDGSVGKS